MKKLAVLLALSWGLVSSLCAQVTVQVMMDQKQFVPNETIPVRVRLVNHSGETLSFGDEDWLSYSVEAEDGLVVFKSGEPPEAHRFTVRSSEMATTPKTDLAPYFLIARPGRYSITATVHIRDWDRAIVSNPMKFDVVRGVVVWEQDFGVPQSPTNHAEPEVRKYMLQQATMSKEMELYLRLMDGAATKTLRVVPVGPLISFSDPQTRIDGASDLHLLYQTGARQYSYTVYNPDGQMLIRQTYVYAASVPRLSVDETGRVGVAGGLRHFEDNDLPSSKEAVLTKVIPPPVDR